MTGHPTIQLFMINRANPSSKTAPYLSTRGGFLCANDFFSG
jgi:hypothetical protein